MDIVKLDLETYYCVKTYSLTKLGNQGYILDPRFQLIGMGIQWPDDRKPSWHVRASLEQQLQRLRDHQQDLITVQHNAPFDAAVLDWRFGFRPAELACTLSMARSLGLDKVSSLSLDALGQLAIEAGYDLPRKGHEVVMASGKRLEDFTPSELAAYGRYCRDDTEICGGLFDIFLRLLSPEELMWQSAVLKMNVHRPLLIDENIVRDELVRVQARRAADLAMLCEKLGVPDEALLLKVIGSGPKLAQAIELFGGVVPMKKSPANGKQTFAFSKTDNDFLDMLEHPIPEVAALVAARLGLKSSIEETRCAKFLELAPRGPLPVPLKVSGAHTHRLSGEGDCNPQNLPSGRKKGQSKALKESLRVPDGWVITGGDSSQVEVRVLDYCANDQQGLTNFRNGICPYSAFAASFWPMPGVTAAAVKKLAKGGDEHWAAKRQDAKTIILASGFGIGAKRFMDDTNAKADADAPKLTFRLAKAYNRGYKDMKPAIPAFWKTCDKVLQLLADGEGIEFGGPTGKLFVADPHRKVLGKKMPGILLPDGMWLTYPDLEFVEVKEWVDILDDETGDVIGRKEEWKNKARFWVKKGRASVPNYTWGGTIVENCLAGDTLVLTFSGWKCLTSVQDSDAVFDGVEFVAHSGIAARGPQECIWLDGVQLTPDHEVLNEDNTWRVSADTHRPYRPTLRPADCCELEPQRREALSLELSMRLRRDGDAERAGRGARSEAGAPRALRVRDGGTSEPPEDAWHEPASGIRRMAVDAGQVPAADASGVAQLRRPGNHGMPGVADVRAVLGGHGADILPGAGPGSTGQQPGVQRGELPVGSATGEHDEQAQHSARGGHPNVVLADRRGQDDAVLPLAPWMDGRAAERTTVEVFDLLNCGPRQRFVVLGNDGPMVVHNCVQAVAFAAMKHQASLLDFPLVYQEHDAHYVASRIEDAPGALANLGWAMDQPPPWALDLPLSCEKGQSPSIGKLVKR